MTVERQQRALVCDVLVTDARVIRRQNYAICVLEGVFQHDSFGALHAAATALVDNEFAALSRAVAALSSGERAIATVQLVSRNRDGRPVLAFELLHLEV